MLAAFGNAIYGSKLKSARSTTNPTRPERGYPVWPRRLARCPAWAIPLKQLQSDNQLLCNFFIISELKTTPESRNGRILFALLFAAGSTDIQFGLYRTLAIVSLLTTPLVFRPRNPKKIGGLLIVMPAKAGIQVRDFTGFRVAQPRTVIRGSPE